MGSDRARVSYDPGRKWRRLVAQQGRVTVEADWNEAASIDAERDRAATLDIVGPVGTPGGYAVTATAGSPGSSTPGDLTVGPGTLYLGGERLDLDAPVDLANQPDWLDQATDTLWVAPVPSPPAPVANELVYLLAIEQEVSALEDPALSDVALGGPDTMQRLRILQHFVRWPTQCGNCTAAWLEIEAAWETIGLNLDAASMRLDSTAALQVGFATEPPPPSPCEPAATSGYLGAENQLIRVQITSIDSAGVPTIVWGYDDATFLYQLVPAAPDGNGNLVLSLAEPPVDSYHYPATGQAVELLSDAASLTSGSTGSTSTSTSDDIAAASGIVSPLTQGYDPSTRTVAIAGPLPPGYSGTQQLYLRAWQGAAPAAAGTPVELTALGAATGVTVTLTPTGGPFHPGDFWRFALRPSVPNLIYPARICASAQNPDGPRVWACPVAFVTWDEPPAVSSCVPSFGNLTGLAGLPRGCCTLNITPADIAGQTSLQKLLESHADQGPITACLAPGTYTLTEPLVLGTGFNDLTLEACGPGAILQAPSSPSSEFVLGLIVIEGASSVTIRGLELTMPLVGFSPSGSFSGLPAANEKLLEDFSRELQVAIGISVDNSVGLTVEDCTFEFPDPGQANTFGAGIYATGAMDGVEVTGCTFQSTRPPTNVPFYDLAAGTQTEPYQLTFGYLQVPIFASAASEEAASQRLSASAASEEAASQRLQDATVEQCLFQGVTVATLVMAQLGTLRIDKNTVRNSYGGFWFLSLGGPSWVTVYDALAGNSDAYYDLAVSGAAALLDPIFLLATAIGRVLPATPPAGGSLVPRRILTPSTAELTLARQAFSGVVTAVPPTIDTIFTKLGAPGSAAPIPAADTGTSVSLRLDLCDCQVDSIIADSYSGAGLFVADLTSGAGSALLHGSRIRSRVPGGETAFALGLGEVAITGNIVANEVPQVVLRDTHTQEVAMRQSPNSYSMVLNAATPYGVPAVAIAGNVFIHPTHLLPAPRPGQAGWDTLNTVINWTSG